MKVLVTGGAGYIGSHTCKALHQAGHKPVVIDNLVYGHDWAVKWGPLYKLDLKDGETLLNVLKKESIEAVVHFAAYAYVGESVKDPAKYYENNLVGGLSLLSAMRSAGIRDIVFSSTCATYGIQNEMISESSPQNPINPYGRSKWMFEKILADFARAYGTRSVALRYFNAAGADPDGEIGEDHDPETHLIPLAIAAAEGRRDQLEVFGNDYPTEDGTCVRDYIHVADLADAHVRALYFLQQHEAEENRFNAMNLGTGKGASVLEVLKAVERSTGKAVPFKFSQRREGDPPSLVADPSKARDLLQWRPQYDLGATVDTAVKWYRRHF